MNLFTNFINHQLAFADNCQVMMYWYNKPNHSS